MIAPETCGKCGAHAMIACNAVEVDNRDLTVSVYKDPTAIVFVGAVTSKLVAFVCGSCGFTELYAEEFARLGAPK